MTNHRINPKAGWAGKLERGPEGRFLCRHCQKEVGKGRRTFCSDECVHEWKIRSDPGYVRDEILKRDKGICAACGLDASRLERIVRKLIKATRESSTWDPRHRRWLEVTAARRSIRKARLQKIADGPLGWVFGKNFNPWCPYLKSSLWQADHIIPVVEGGGECGLDNYRTLCSPCHKKVTKELAGRRAAARKKLKDA